MLLSRQKLFHKVNNQMRRTKRQPHTQPPFVQAEHVVSTEQPFNGQKSTIVSSPKEDAAPSRFTSNWVAVAMMGTMGTIVELGLRVAPTKEYPVFPLIVKSRPLKEAVVQFPGVVDVIMTFGRAVEITNRKK